MSDLDRLLRRADRVPAPDLWPDIEAREPRADAAPSARRMGAAILGLAVAGSGIVVAARAFLRERQPDPPASALEADPKITAEINVGQFPQEIAFGEGAVWVAVNQADPPERWYVARVDPATNRVTDEIEVREVLDVAAGEGAVWATTYEPSTGWGLVRIDPDTRSVVHTIPFGCEPECTPSQVTVRDRAVWVTASTGYPERGQVIRIDPSSDRVVARIEVPGDPRDLVADENGVWVVSLTHWTACCVGGGTLLRIDPETNTLTARVLDGRIPPASGVSAPPVLSVAHGFVWTSAAPGDPTDLADQRIDIVRVDPASNQTTGRTGLGTLFFPIGSDERGIWFRGGYEDASPTIALLDPLSMQVTSELRLDTTVLDGALDRSTGTIWLSTYKDSVVRIDLVPAR